MHPFHLPNPVIVAPNRHKDARTGEGTGRIRGCRARQGRAASFWLSRGGQPPPGSAGEGSHRLDSRRKVWPRHILQGPDVPPPGARPVFLCGGGFALVYRGAVGTQSCRAFHALRDDTEMFHTSIASKTPARQNLSPFIDCGGYQFFWQRDSSPSYRVSKVISILRRLDNSFG
jgi:hypothetical protein